jgi:hypothetical protein
MNQKHIEEHDNHNSHLQFVTLQKNKHMFKCFHIANQCSTFVDFMLEFYCYLKVLIFSMGNTMGWYGHHMVCTICDVTIHDYFEDIMMHIASSKHVQNQQARLLQPLFQNVCKYLNICFGC